MDSVLLLRDSWGWQQGGWRGKVLRWRWWRGASPGCPPCVYLGRAAPLPDPALVRCWNRPRPYCPASLLGVEHTTVTEQGSRSHPTDWMGTLWGEGPIGLTCPAHYEVAEIWKMQRSEWRVCSMTKQKATRRFWLAGWRNGEIFLAGAVCVDALWEQEQSLITVRLLKTKYFCQAHHDWNSLNELPLCTEKYLMTLMQYRHLKTQILFFVFCFYLR